MSLAYARERIRGAAERTDLNGLEDVLWDAAIFAEGGELADAERALRAAEKALTEALARGDSPEEIQKLMEAYREAANRYMEALIAQAMINGDTMESLPGMAGGDMSQDQIQEMLQALQDLAETGSNDDARRLLQALNDMLLNMQVQLAMGQGGGGEMSPELQALQEALEELGELIGEQRGLMDETYAENEGEGEGARSRPGQSPRPGEGEPQAGGEGEQGDQAGRGEPGDRPGSSQGGGSLASRQGELGDQTGTVREGLGAGAGEEDGEGAGGRTALEDAEEAMRRAAEALGRGRGEEALDAQGEAIEALRDAAEALSREAMNAARSAEEGGFTDGLGTPDPFGRPSGGAGAIGQQGVEIPSEMERRRAREILDELRKRAGEAERPQEELDYIKRLLDRF
jgi:uncharacterized protein (TIGR02302 family)